MDSKFLLRTATGLMIAATIFACSRAPKPQAYERIGSVSNALYANGIPCTLDTQCTSAHCIDSVCCDTACGGGVRDLLACSNIYGAVAGLTDGTCKTLVPGDFCGALTTVNPCTWRGTVVNNGGNCPNPPGGSSACFPCADSTQCSGTFNVCVNGACVQCDGDNGGGTPAACPGALPICQTGICQQCSATNGAACSGTTPACDLATKTCAACNGDNGSGGTQSCPTTAAPACLASGACVQCSATNAVLCTGTTPSCNTTTNTCAACNGDNGTAVTQPCPTTTDPYCFTTGAVGSCGKCTSSLDCVGHPAGAACNIATGSCGNVCAQDTDCNDATKWCANLVCTTKTANGQPLPAVAPINSTCTVANGTRACASGVCDTTDNLCGLPNGATCGPPPSNTVCRSDVCSATDNKCGLPQGEPCNNQGDCRSGVCAAGKCGTCQTDAQCTAIAAQVCDDTTKLCISGCRGVGGNGCPAGDLCTSTDATIGACVKCITDANCGTSTSGKVCNASKICQDGCRGSGGNGCSTGQTCSSLDGTIGTCSGAITDAGADAGGDAGGNDGGNVGTDSGTNGVVDGGYGGADSGIPTGNPVVSNGALEGGGCSCDVAKTSQSDVASMAVVGLAISAFWRRRSNKRKKA